MNNDRALVSECHRILKDAGYLIILTPHCKRMALLGPFRKGAEGPEGRPVGRPGYTQAQLFEVIKDGFDVCELSTYSRFFVELVNAITGFFLQGARRRWSMNEAADAAGLVEAQMTRVYGIAYPFYWLANQLDLLLFFTKGYNMVAVARRKIWRERKAPVLVDGRSIADATINTKIGTAAPF
jgi:hypothetical protein